MVQEVPQGARLNQGPGCSRFGTKVAVHWEGLVVFIHDIVDSSACGILQHHDIFTRPRQSDLTHVSAKTLCACAPVSSLCDVTHYMTGAAVLTWWHVTAFVVTGLIRAALARNTQKKNITVGESLSNKTMTAGNLCELALFQTLWRLFNGGHIGVPKQWKEGHFGVSNKSCGSWTLSLGKRFLLFKWMCIYAGHVSKDALLANWRYSSSRDQLKLFSVQNGFIFLKNFLAEQLPVFVWD